MNTNRMIVLCLFILGVPAISVADDWPQWRGPDRTDVSAEKGLLQEWPEGGPKKLWTNKKTGLGYAGFSIVGNRLFTMGLEDNKEFALCLDANTGEEIWRQDFAKKYPNGWGDGPRSTPTVDEDRVYCMSGQGTLVCLKVADGSVAWDVKMSDFGGAVPNWGFAESPLVDGDLIACTPGGDQGAIVALNKMSGEKVWQTSQLTPGAHYSSMIAVDCHGKRQFIQQLQDSIVGIVAKTGDVLWSHKWPGQTAVIPTPIFHDNKVYVSAGYGVGCCQLEIGPNGDVKANWTNKVMQNQHGGVIYVDGFYFGYSELQRGLFTCQSAKDGKAAWTDKTILKGSLTYADGCFYHFQEKDGQAVLFTANGEGFTEKGRFKFEPQTKRRSPSGAIWVHPVVANGKLYLRDQEIICCYDVLGK